MNVDENVKALLKRVRDGHLNTYAAQLEGSDFGLYLPLHAQGETVKMMLQGYSQMERNLKVSISKTGDGVVDAKPIAWIGGKEAKDSKCKHGGTTSCKHCTAHPSDCRHCTKHPKNGIADGDLQAPELHYDDAIKKLEKIKPILDILALDDFGVTLLHGHNNAYMFTKLPEDYVSVICEGVTTFRKRDDIENDLTFVPNIWRFLNGKPHVAGGYSSLSLDNA